MLESVYTILSIAGIIIAALIWVIVKIVSITSYKITTDSRIEALERKPEPETPKSVLDDIDKLEHTVSMHTEQIANLRGDVKGIKEKLDMLVRMVEKVEKTTDNIRNIMLSGVSKNENR